MRRRVESELLDHMDTADPEAIRSRMDLVRLNSWMGNAKVIARFASSVLPRIGPAKIADIGACDGMLLKRVLRRLGPREPMDSAGTVYLVDRQSVASADLIAEFAALGWRMSLIHQDVFQWSRETSDGPFDLIIANLFLHHFEARDLQELFATLAPRTRAFIAIETRRNRAALLLAKVLWMIGCNRITRHDAVLSIRAGFADRELSACWPGTGGWQLHEARCGMASHCFTGTRLCASS